MGSALKYFGIKRWRWNPEQQNRITTLRAELEDAIRREHAAWASAFASTQQRTDAHRAVVDILDKLTEARKGSDENV